MTKEVKLIECPRDAWQGLKGQIPTDVKVEYLRALAAGGDILDGNADLDHAAGRTFLADTGDPGP